MKSFRFLLVIAAVCGILFWAEGTVNAAEEKAEVGSGRYQLFNGVEGGTDTKKHILRIDSITGQTSMFWYGLTVKDNEGKEGESGMLIGWIPVPEGVKIIKGDEALRNYLQQSIK